MVKTTETFTFFLNKKLYKYKNNKLYQNNRKLGGDVVDIGKKCEGEIKDCIHAPENKEVVGVGGFGKVSRFVCNGVKYVMKRSENENKNIVRNEINILMQLNVPTGHRNIIEYICSYENLVDNYIILPCAQKDLGLFLMEERDPLIVAEQYAIMDNLLKGIDYMHKKNVIHNDIKDENILIMPDFAIKYCDFGLSFVIQPDEKQKQINDVLYSGTKEYIVPESFTYDDLHNNYDVFEQEYNHFVNTYELYAKDYWCLGQVFYHILNKTDTFAYTIGDLLNRKFENPMVPDWLKTTLLNSNDIERKPPEQFNEDMIKNDSTLNTGAQSGGFKNQNKKTYYQIKTMDSQKPYKKLDNNLYDKFKRIMNDMKLKQKDKDRNYKLYGDQPRLKKPSGVINRFN